MEKQDWASNWSLKSCPGNVRWIERAEPITLSVAFSLMYSIFYFPFSASNHKSHMKHDFFILCLCTKAPLDWWQLSTLFVAVIAALPPTRSTGAKSKTRRTSWRMKKTMSHRITGKPVACRDKYGNASPFAHRANLAKKKNVWPSQLLILDARRRRRRCITLRWFDSGQREVDRRDWWHRRQPDR